MPAINFYQITPDGDLLLTTQATSFDELTRQLPPGFYTTFRTYAGGKRVLGLDAHLKRLYQPAILQKVKPELTATKLRSELASILKSYPGESRVRLILAGSGEIYIALTSLIILPEEIYRNGVKVITTDVQRERPRLKLTSFITNSKNVRNQIAGSDVFEALLLRNNVILEGMTSNFFYIKDGRLGTARENILLGVTRRTVLRVGRGIGLEIDYRPLQQEQIAALDEAFLTSSSRGIVPIIQIDHMKVGAGIPGTITKYMIDAYNTYVVRHAEVI